MNGQRLLDAVSWLTTPLLPGDYLGQINPLWSARELRGRVGDVLAETSDAATLVIRPGRGWGPHRAGQYVRVGVDIDGTLHWRSYSVSSAPGRADGCFTITVKADPCGLVSRHLVHRARPGTILRLGHPAGEFVLPDPLPRRLLFLTAGSGITPVMAMLRELADHGMAPDVLLVHSAPTPEEVIFGTELRDLAARTVNLRLVERHTRQSGRFTLGELPMICPNWASRDTWACGPASLLDDVERHWRQTRVSPRLHVERFQPSAPVRGGAGGRVRFTRSGREAEANGSTPLLEVGEEAGVLMPSGCRMGICYSCVAPLKSGRIRDLRTGLHHGDEGELVQTCVSAAAGTVEIDL